MPRPARATADDEHSPASAPQRREVLVTVLAVVPVVVSAVLAAVMHAPPDPRAAGAIQPPPLVQQADRLAAACAGCGVVEAVVPIARPAAEPGAAWQIRIRMDDGSVRTVEQPGVLAAGSRVIVAGASVRVLSNRPGQG